MTCCCPGSVPSLETLSAEVVIKDTKPNLSLCNQYLCELLLDLCITNNQLRMFRILLETWPHQVAHLRLKASRLHYLQSLAILEHQRAISKELKRVYVNAPYAGYISTNVLCSAALGLLEDYSCLVSQVKHVAEQCEPPHRKRQKVNPEADSDANRILSVYTPLNINSTNIKTLLRYLKTPQTSKIINVVPSALIFTSLQSSLIFKALSFVNSDELKMLGVDFSLQSEEELSSDGQLTLLTRFTDLRSISLTYNYLRGHEKENNLMNTLKSLPSLLKLNLSGNLLKDKTHTYISPTMRELVLGNTYPTNESLKMIGQISGDCLLRLKLSDNGINNRLQGLSDMLSKCRSLLSLDLSGNQLATNRDILTLLRGLEQVEATIESLTLSHNMFREPERLIIIAEMSKFSCLKELVLGPFLPDLLLSDDVTRTERKLMSETCGRPDISMVYPFCEM